MALPKLSNLQEYLNSDPETAEAIAQIFNEVLADERVQKVLIDNGISPASLLDQPITSRGIALFREMQRQNQGIGTGSTLTGGLAPPGVQRGAADFLSSFGLTGGLPLEASPPGSTIPLGPFEVEPARALTNIGATLLPYIATSGAAAAATKGITSPLLRGAATYGGQFSALELARQLGRKLGQGEKIDVSEIGREALIGGAAGLPLGSGLFGRLRQAGAVGVTSAATSLLPGQVFDLTRTSAEALFSALFPVGKLPQSPFEVPISQAELLERAAVEAATKPAQRIQDITKKRLAQLNPKDLKELGPDFDRAILDQLFRNPNELSSQYFRARAAAAKSLSSLPEEYLREIMAKGGPEADFAGDALAYQLKATKPIESEPLDPLPPKLVQLGGNTPTPEVAKQIAENEALSVIREYVLAHKLGEAGISVPPSLVRTELPEPKFAAEAEQIARPFVNPVPPKIKTPYADRAKLALYIETTKRAGELESALKAYQGIEATPLNVETMRGLAENITALRKKADQLLDPNTLVSIDFPIDAIYTAKVLTQGMNARQLQTFKNNLPDFLEPHREVVEKALTPVKGKGQTGTELINKTIEELRKQKILSSAAGDLPLRRALSPTPTFKTVKLLARQVGANLDTEGREFVLNLKGQSIRFKTIKQVVDQIEKFAKGEIDSVLTLDEAAAQRGMSAIHVGDGKYKVVDHVTGEVKDVANPSAAAAEVAKVPSRADASPEITVAGPDVIPGTAISGRVYRSGARPAVAMIELPEYRTPSGKVPENLNKALEDHPVRFGKYLEDRATSFTKIEEAMPAFPVYSALFEPFIKLSSLRQQFIQPYVQELNKTFRGVRGDRMAAIQDVFLARGDSRELMAQFHKLNGQERRAVTNLEHWYARLLNINDEGVRELQGSMGKFREVAGDPRRVLGDNLLPRMFEGVRSAVERGKLRPDGANADEVALSFLHELANSRFRINDLMDRGREMLTRLKHMEATGPGSQKTRNFIEGSQHILHNFLSVAGDRSDLSARAFSETFNDTITPMFKKWGRLFGDERKYVRGDYLSVGDLERISSMFTSWYAGIAMSGRLALAFRNLFQVLLNGPKVGFGRTLKSLGEATDPATAKVAWEDARKAGVINDMSGLIDFDELNRIHEGVFRTAHRIGLTPYQGVEKLNRVTSYLAGRRAIRDEAEAFLSNPAANLNKFLLNTGLAGDSSIVQRTVLSKLRNRGIDEAADYYGLHVANQTQFMYNRQNLPEWLTTRWGRLFGQFGVWPVGFANYMRRNAIGAIGDDPIARNYALKFIAKYAILQSSINLLGAATAVDTSGWNFASPWSFEGGPAFQLLRDVGDVFQAGSEYKYQLALSELQRAAEQVPIPFGSLIHDLAQSGQETDPVRQFLAATGFNLAKETQ